MAKAKAKVPATTLAYKPTRKYQVDHSEERLIQLVETLPKGIFAIVCNENARYTAFHGSTSALVMPIGSRISFHTGAYVVDSCNRSVMGLADDDDWIMFMGDDHVFPPEIGLKLLTLMYAKDLDIIVPVCFKRSFPPTPVLYEWRDPAEVEKESPDPNILVPVDLDKYPEGGLIEVYAAGTAGMIIRRRVFEKMQTEKMTPWFELGQGGWGEDLYFCHKAQQLGFKVWADLDMSLGHILNTSIWPVRHVDGGEWACFYDFNTQGGFNLALSADKSAFMAPNASPLYNVGEG